MMSIVENFPGFLPVGTGKTRLHLAPRPLSGAPRVRTLCGHQLKVALIRDFGNESVRLATVCENCARLAEVVRQRSTRLIANEIEWQLRFEGRIGAVANENGDITIPATCMRELLELMSRNGRSFGRWGYLSWIEAWPALQWQAQKDALDYAMGIGDDDGERCRIRTSTRAEYMKMISESEARADRSRPVVAAATQVKALKRLLAKLERKGLSTESTKQKIAEAERLHREAAKEAEATRRIIPIGQQFR